jgi:iron complex outermembrane receptor protein
MQRLALTRQAWDASLAWRWYSRVWDVPGTLEDPASPGYVPRKVAAYSVVDAQLTHAFSRRLSLTLSVRNLFDRVPPYTRQSISFQQGYDPQAADPLGRFVALRARCSFD